jgi:hypothetical protein
MQICMTPQRNIHDAAKELLRLSILLPLLEHRQLTYQVLGLHSIEYRVSVPIDPIHTTPTFRVIRGQDAMKEVLRVMDHHRVDTLTVLVLEPD